MLELSCVQIFFWIIDKSPRWHWWQVLVRDDRGRQIEISLSRSRRHTEEKIGQIETLLGDVTFPKIVEILSGNNTEIITLIAVYQKIIKKVIKSITLIIMLCMVNTMQCSSLNKMYDEFCFSECPPQNLSNFFWKLLPREAGCH